MLALTLAGFDSLRVLIPLLLVSFAFLGLVIPSTMVLSLENHGRIAGIASSAPEPGTEISAAETGAQN